MSLLPSRVHASLGISGNQEFGQRAHVAPVQQQEPSAGSVTGNVVDVTGTPVSGAQIRLVGAAGTNQEAVSDEDGRFFFTALPSGNYQLTINAPGFASRSISGFLNAGEAQTLTQITLAVAATSDQVTVSVSSVEIAEDQIKAEEKQRVLKVIPNFYVSYVPDAEPLSSRQKFHLAWKSMIDPVNFGVTAAVAGLEQSQNEFSGFGQGGTGYAKRLGATYADFVSGNMIGGAILPSLLKQDPRYFYKGTGSKKSRVIYALKNSVMCRGDNGRTQVNYSAIAGGLIAGGISNLYYPESDRNGARLTIENTLIGIGATATVNLIQEFVLKRFTSNVPLALNSSPHP